MDNCSIHAQAVASVIKLQTCCIDNPRA
jgi:hypothetical protein